MQRTGCRSLVILPIFVFIWIVPSFSKSILSFNDPHYYQQSPSEGKRVRIIQAEAVLRIDPNINSPIIRKLPFGAVLSLRREFYDWVLLDLPADKEGIVVSGWIQKSFIEIEIDSINQEKAPPEIAVNKEASLPAKEAQKGSFYWKIKMDKAKSKRDLGMGISVGGAILSVTGLVLALKASSGGEQDSTGRWVMSISGLALAIVGYAIESPAKAEIRALELEGAREGYMISSMGPSLGIKIKFSF